ncbi:MAG: hypothetical protein OXO49_01865 [Gammaproteobacteria bacterium]|nr:hypothetical protein [Gammaproteobacteria bacterium]MDE0252705.1 hypothetical protein [Gammaproteobacteria bacterium]MDE0402393.1 hypothetical protein [Gammaproteobacteria bacterium]
MNFNEQREIESLHFDIRANVASGLDVLLSVIADDPAVLSLQKKLREDSSVIYSLIAAMRRLRDSKYDEQCRNSYDTAMTTYGWIIASVYPNLTGLVADLLRSLPNAWWSLYLAQDYQSRMQKNLVSHVPNGTVIESIEDGNEVSFWKVETNFCSRSRNSEFTLGLIKVEPWNESDGRDTFVQEVQANLGGNPALDKFNMCISPTNFSVNLPSDIFIGQVSNSEVDTTSTNTANKRKDLDSKSVPYKCDSQSATV